MLNEALNETLFEFRVAGIVKRRTGSLAAFIRRPMAKVSPAGAERRRHTRCRVLLGARIQDLSGATLFNCRVSDLSVSGARIQLSTYTPLPEIFKLALTDGRVRTCRRVRQVMGHDDVSEIGVAFIG